MRYHKNQERGALNGFGEVRHGGEVVGERYAGQVFRILVLFLNRFGQHGITDPHVDAVNAKVQSLAIEGNLQRHGRSPAAAPNDTHFLFIRRRTHCVVFFFFSSSFSFSSFSSSSYVLLSCCGFAQSHTSNKWKDGVFVDFWIHTKKNLVGRPTLSKHVPYSKRSYSSLIMSLLKMVSCLFRDMSLTPNGIIRA